MRLLLVTDRSRLRAPHAVDFVKVEVGQFDCVGEGCEATGIRLAKLRKEHWWRSEKQQERNRTSELQIIQNEESLDLKTARRSNIFNSSTRLMSNNSTLYVNCSFK